MTEANSPTYHEGLADGFADEARIKSCPPLPPDGPNPPFPEHPIMYLRGYWTAYTDAPHVCTDRCRRRTDDHERQPEDSSSAA